MSDDLSRSVSLAQLFRLALARDRRDIHTAIPGRVESYDADKQLVDVQPLIKAVVPIEGGGTQAETLPVLSSIPVQFPAGGGMRIVLPLKQGDTGWVMFSEASLDAWQAQGGLVDPQDARRCHLADATFLPGLKDNGRPFTGANDTDASFGKDGAHQVVITPDVIELGGNINDRPNDYVALATPTHDMLVKIHDAVNAGFGKLRSDLSSISSHTHLLPTGAVGTEGTAVKQANVAPINVPASLSLASLSNPEDCGSIDDVKSSIVKAK